MVKIMSNSDIYLINQNSKAAALEATVHLRGNSNRKLEQSPKENSSPSRRHVINNLLWYWSRL